MFGGRFPPDGVLTDPSSTTHVKVRTAVNDPSDTVTLTEKVPTVFGAPGGDVARATTSVLNPDELIVNPVGRPVAVNVKRLPLGSLADSGSDTVVFTTVDWFGGCTSVGAALAEIGMSTTASADLALN